jgi:hypothetical protein
MGFDSRSSIVAIETMFLTQLLSDVSRAVALARETEAVLIAPPEDSSQTHPTVANISSAT